MNSENMKLKEEKTKKIANDEQTKEKMNDEITNVNEEEIKRRMNTIIHARQISPLADSIINYLSIGICLFVYGCYLLGFFNVDKDQYMQFFMGYFLVGGIALYIVGIINWYEGKELIFLIDFILSFLFITLFLKDQYIGNISDSLGAYDNDQLQGVFYIMLFCFVFAIGISSKRKGFLYIMNYAVLFVSFVFLFAYKFFKTEILKTIDGYMLILCGALYWATGTLRLLNSPVNAYIKFLEPSD